MKKAGIYGLLLCLLMVCGCQSAAGRLNSALPSGVDATKVVAIARSDDGKFGFIDTTGAWVLQPVFDEAMRFREGLAPVKQNGKWGYIDISGKFEIEPQFDYAIPFSEGLALVYIQNGNSTEEWFINTK
jgi:hypothetical protein